jgi:formylglycine-generating enzyme required for sulfatase activity
MKKMIIWSVVFVFALIASQHVFAQGTGIEVYTPEPGVKVFVNGEEKGKTEYVSFAAVKYKNLLRIELSPGTYTLRFEYPGYQFSDSSVRVSQTGFTPHIIEFSGSKIRTDDLGPTVSSGQVETGTINVRSSPTQAYVELDGRQLDKRTDNSTQGVAIGPHRVRVYFNQTDSYSTEFTLEAGSTITVIADFFKKTILVDAVYTIGIETEPKGAQIFVDGRALSVSPASLQIPFGSHELSVVLDGYETYLKTIDVKESKKYSIALSKIGSGAQGAVPSATGSKGKDTPAESADRNSAPSVDIDSEPIIPNTYIVAYKPTASETQNVAHFEDQENKRARTLEQDVHRLLVDNAIPQGITPSVQEFLTKISALDAKSKELSAYFEKSISSGLDLLGAFFDREIQSIKTENPIDPWENDEEYAQRLLPLTRAVLESKSKDLARYQALLGREKKERVGAVDSLLKEISSTFSIARYYVASPRITYTVGTFDRDKKTWPISIVSTEPDFPYAAQFDYSLAREKDLGTAYRTFTNAISAGTVEPRVEYSYARKAGSSMLSVIIQEATLVDTKTQARFTGGGDKKPVFGISAENPSNRLPMPKLALQSALPNTTVSIGDTSYGICPVTLTLEPGIYTVKFSWNKVPISGESKTIGLDFGQSAQYKAGADIGFIHLEGLPEGARLMVNDTPLAGKLEELALKAGNTVLKIADENYRPWSSEVAVVAGAIQKVKINSGKMFVPLVFVQGGTFSMGSNSGDSDEKPVHQVTISSFMIGKYEVTQEQYQRVIGTNPSYFASGSDAGKRPVEQVSWYDAVAFCNRLSEMEGLEKVYVINGTNVNADFKKNGYRLPTEAEWEYAARGGEKSKNFTYAGSNDIDQVGWYSSNSGNQTREAGTKASNELGIYDMSGNVWEWCWDWYGSYGSGQQTDPLGASSGSYRVSRGGSWGDSAGGLRSAYRGSDGPDGRSSYIGFRVARRP